MIFSCHFITLKSHGLKQVDWNVWRENRHLALILVLIVSKDYRKELPSCECKIYLY